MVLCTPRCLLPQRSGLVCASPSVHLSTVKGNICQTQPRQAGDWLSVSVVPGVWSFAAEYKGACVRVNAAGDHEAIYFLGWGRFQSDLPVQCSSHLQVPFGDSAMWHVYCSSDGSYILMAHGRYPLRSSRSHLVRPTVRKLCGAQEAPPKRMGTRFTRGLYMTILGFVIDFQPCFGIAGACR